MTYRIYLTVILFLTAFMSYAGGEDKTPLDYVITKNEVDNSLSKTEALFVFTFKIDPEGTLVQQVIKGGCNGITKDINPDSKGKNSLKVTPGKYFFQFFLTSDYFEVQTDSITIEPGHRIEITVNFQSSTLPVISFKPVIYVYPKESTSIHIQLDLKGEFLFTYPAYNSGWNFTADPNGTIHMNNKEYKYLFWDGTTNINAANVKWDEGFIVDRENLLSFLEEKLTQMGLTNSEQQDYITFWYPLMSKNESNYIHFLFNEEYDNYAHLTVTPKPDRIFRVYMMWGNAENMGNAKLNPQSILSFEREGFTLVEWGGAQLPEIPTIEL